MGTSIDPASKAQIADKDTLTLKNQGPDEDQTIVVKRKTDGHDHDCVEAGCVTNPLGAVIDKTKLPQGP